MPSVRGTLLAICTAGIVVGLEPCFPENFSAKRTGRLLQQLGPLDLLRTERGTWGPETVAASSSHTQAFLGSRVSEPKR